MVCGCEWRKSPIASSERVVSADQWEEMLGFSEWRSDRNEEVDIVRTIDVMWGCKREHFGIKFPQMTAHWVLVQFCLGQHS